MHRYRLNIGMKIASIITLITLAMLGEFYLMTPPQALAHFIALIASCLWVVLQFSPKQIFWGTTALLIATTTLAHNEEPTENVSIGKANVITATTLLIETFPASKSVAETIFQDTLKT